MNIDTIKMKKHYWAALAVTMIAFSNTPILATPGITQLTNAIRNDTQAARTDLQATLTNENAIYANITETLTVANNIVFDPADSFATMTTANSIKFDTQNTITIGQAILLDAIATRTTTDLILTEAIATMTTAAAIKADSQQTVINDQTSTAYLAAITTLTGQIYTDVHASLTTANTVLTESINAANLSTNAYNTLNSTNTIIQAIKVDTTNLVTQVNQIQTDVHATLTSANLIAAQTIVLALPIVGSTTITAAGAYRVVNPVNPCQIIIDHDDVCLMLNGLSLSNSAGHVIIINPGIKNVYIANGQIIGGGIDSVFDSISIGTAIGAFCENITIEHVAISSARVGIAASNTNQCVFRDIRTSNCRFGISAGAANLLRIRDCVFQIDTGTVREQSFGIEIGNGGYSFVGPSIRDCTFANCATGISLLAVDNAEIINCKSGDFTINTYPGGKNFFQSIMAGQSSNVIIDNCSVQNIILGLVAGKTNQGIYCESCQNFVISRCNVQNLQATTAASTVNGIKTLGCSNMDIGFCTVNDLISPTVQGISFDNNAPSYGVVHDSIASYMQGSTTGFGFYLDNAPSTDTTCIFYRNIGTTPTAPSLNFSANIPNVTSGYNGTNVIDNFSLPT